MSLKRILTLIISGWLIIPSAAVGKENSVPVSEYNSCVDSLNESIDEGNDCKDRLKKTVDRDKELIKRLDKIEAEVKTIEKEKKLFQNLFAGSLGGLVILILMMAL